MKKERKEREKERHSDWLDQAQQPIRDALGGWGEVNHSEPPYYGLHG